MDRTARLAAPRTLLASLTAALLAAVTLTAVPTSSTTPAVDLPSLPRLTSSTPAPGAHVADDVARAVAAGPTTVVVQATPASVAAARDAVEAAGGQVVLDLEIVSGFSALVDAASLDAVASVPGVRHVTLDDEVVLAHDEDEDGNKPSADSFYPETVGADVLHADGVDGSGVGIAIIDTGVSEVADLEGRVVGSVDFSGSPNEHVDEYGHGTFIAGIAAGDGTLSGGEHAGVAPGAHVIPVKIAGRNGAADVSHVLAAMQYVVSFKDVYDIGVLNLSVGTDSTQPQSLSPLNYAVERAWDAGIVVVVSGGNLGEQGPGRIPKPADDPLVITVGATDSNGTTPRGDDEVAGYSSQGPSIADGFEKPDIVAPGSHLVSLIAPGSRLADHSDAHVDSNHARGSGTSFAAGVVSGAAALLLQAHPDWTPDQVKDAITSSAAPGPVGERNIDGHGALDVPAAVSTSPAPGSQGLVVRSSGLGSLEADRGSVELEISSSGLFNTVDYLLGLVIRLIGETTAQNEDFDAEAFVADPWTEASWYGSSWWGSSWWGSSWWGSSWWGSSWWGSSWWSADGW